MDLNQYKTDAIRTESTIDAVVVNELLLVSVIDQMKHLGSILDQIKKHAFYGKEYDMEAMASAIAYSAESRRTLDTITANEVVRDERNVQINPRIFHAVVGMTTEAVELMEALRLYDGKMDLVNIGEEWADCCWYGSILMDELEQQLGESDLWETVLNRNIAKLKLRYPDKFTSEAAINRDVKAERKILEGNPGPSEST